MKKLISKVKLLIIVFLVITIFFACKKENTYPEPSISQEIAKIETIFKAGDVKIETTLQPGETKIETRASTDYLANLLNNFPQERLKPKTDSKTSDRVGVIVDYSQNCGSYDKLEITMDNEDRRNANSYTGWIGGNTWQGNAVLRFCLVPKTAFQSSKYYKYAVLSLDYEYISTIERFFDNEDGTNITNVKLNGSILSQQQIYDQIGNGIYLDGVKNLRLCFTVFEQDPVNGMESFPSLSIAYGVFGYFGTFAKGKLHTDDEDTNNANLEWYWWQLVYGPGDDYWDLVHDIVEPTEMGANTSLWMTRVRTY